MGAAGALTAARQIKTSWWGADRRSGGTNGSRGQRLGLPSSVIICMLVPLFFSWLSETSGSSLPGLANGDETVQGRGRNGVVITGGFCCLSACLFVCLFVEDTKEALCCAFGLTHRNLDSFWGVHGCPVYKQNTPTQSQSCHATLPL